MNSSVDATAEMKILYLMKTNSPLVKENDAVALEGFINYQ